jgi:hypothetical protein
MKRKILAVLLVNLVPATGDMTRPRPIRARCASFRRFRFLVSKGASTISRWTWPARLFRTSGNNTVEVIDLKKGERVRAPGSGPRG